MEYYIAKNSTKSIGISQEKLAKYPIMYLTKLHEYRKEGLNVDMYNECILLDDCEEDILEIISRLINSDFDKDVINEYYLDKN